MNQIVRSDVRQRVRVCIARGERARIVTDGQELEAAVRGSLISCGDVPVTGDWVRGRPIDSHLFLIEEIEPRVSKIARRAAGRAGYEQVLAANIDTALIVCGLDGDFNERRLERYLAICHEGGVLPVVVLNKLDICASIPSVRAAQVLAISARTGQGLEQLTALLRPGCTFVLLGSSGAGKSTIVNRLLHDDRQRTNEVREHDARGRHTTTTRELIGLQAGAWLIDTPGLREIQLLVGADALDTVFDEIAELAKECRFKDCTHANEPGCAVRGAVDAQRLASFHKLQREARHLSGELREKQQWRSAAKAMKQLYKQREKP